MSNYTGAVPDTARKTTWRDLGACNGEDPDLFAPDGTTGRWVEVIADAKAVCARCPVAAECLEWALETRQNSVIYGGLTEDERKSLLRRQAREARHPVQKPRGPRQPPPESLEELFGRHTSPSTDGHLTWTGAEAPIFRGRKLTPSKISFMLDRGREPDGPVKRLCGVQGCVQPRHLTDTEERTQCGTRPGHARHRERGEEACDPCKRANADADNRLRWTGSTKAVV